MSLTRADVAKVAQLARLALNDTELDTMTAQLGSIIGYIEQLNELDTSNVQPLSHPLEVLDVFRPDQLEPSYPREVMLATAPRADQEFYLVPPVLGE